MAADHEMVLFFGKHKQRQCPSDWRLSLSHYQLYSRTMVLIMSTRLTYSIDPRPHQILRERYIDSRRSQWWETTIRCHYQLHLYNQVTSHLLAYIHNIQGIANETSILVFYFSGCLEYRKLVGMLRATYIWVQRKYLLFRNWSGCGLIIQTVFAAGR